MRNIFFRPPNGFAGDPIPFYSQGTYYIYYLHDTRQSRLTADKTTWNLITSSNFADWKNWGTVLPIGGMDDPDLSCYTGSVYQDNDGGYHLFYTAQNPENPAYCENGRAKQYIIHATSTDLIHWEKHYDSVFGCNNRDYEMFDWRDPFVFYIEDEGVYGMLLAARKINGSFRRGGSTVLLRSPDLYTWDQGMPFFEPDQYFTHECPDLFRWGDWWYLVYSTFTEQFVTHYRMSRSLNGPWLIPDNDTFDARGFYAAKTAGYDEERYVIGWIPTKCKNSDFGYYEWGGNLAVHQLLQCRDGSLKVRVPEGIKETYKKKFPLIPVQPAKAQREKMKIELMAPDRKDYFIFEELPDACCINTRLTFHDNPQAFGIAIHMDDTLDNGYFYRFEPHYNRLVFDMWPRSEEKEQQHRLGGDRPFECSFERPIKLVQDKCLDVIIVIEYDICVVYVNNEIAMSTRTCNMNGNKKWGFFVYGGALSVTEYEVLLPE